MQAMRAVATWLSRTACPASPVSDPAVAALLVVVFLGLGAGCASTQEVSIQCIPEEVEIYVDGRLLEGTPESLELRSDEPHKIFLKRGGYEPQLVVLEPVVDEQGRVRLPVDDLCIELVPIGMGRELDIEVERDIPAELH